MFLDKLKDKKVWERIRSDKKYEFILNEIVASYEECKSKDIPTLKYSQYMQFYRNGSRGEYELLYFGKRKRLYVCAAMTMIFPENTEYVAELLDIIWSICDEYSWCLPAHGSAEDLYFIDLFAAETAFALSEIIYMAGNKLDTLVVSRVKNEVKKRIVDTFESRELHWEFGGDNWSAVCAAGTAIAYMYFFPDRFLIHKERFNKSMECFLSGYYDDGICREGYVYWSFGFGFYTAYAKRLFDFTNGKDNLFEIPKVHEIAKYSQNCTLEKNVLISFADSSADTGYNIGLLHFLHSVYSDVICIGSIDSVNTFTPRTTWVSFIDKLVHYNTEYVLQQQETEIGSAYFKDTAIYISRQSNCSFAIKAGTNNEPHNHNDVGNIIFASENQQVICDIGPGVYSADYFSDKRYESFAASSRGHNLPIINDSYQCFGEEYCGIMSVADNVVNVDITKAYKIDTLDKFVRKCTLKNNGLTVCDSFSFKQNNNKIIERFVSLIKPKIIDNSVYLGRVHLVCSEACTPCISVECIPAHRHNTKKTVYIIDYNFEAEYKKDFVLEALV